MENVKKSTWIGLNDFQDTQTLTWSDKSRVTYTKWYAIAICSPNFVQVGKGGREWKTIFCSGRHKNMSSQRQDFFM